jgi:hypothetical protein
MTDSFVFDEPQRFVSHAYRRALSLPYGSDVLQFIRGSLRILSQRRDKRWRKLHSKSDKTLECYPAITNAREDKNLMKRNDWGS